MITVRIKSRQRFLDRESCLHFKVLPPESHSYTESI
jgi:hypothetical protein